MTSHGTPLAGGEVDKLELTDILLRNPEWIDTLKEAVAVEKREESSLGWEWYEVHTPIHVLHKMVSARILDITLSTRSGTHFKIRDRQLVEEVLNELEVEEVGEREERVPEDLFSSITGHEKIKSVLRYALEAKGRVGVLLSGPPASAKTLFLMELHRLPNSYYLLAQTTSGPGLALLLREQKPKYLLIDEIDRLNPHDVGVLNSVLATGIVSETKYGKTYKMILDSIKVFAAGIRIERLASDLLSRFIKLQFPPYSKEEFEKVVISVLTKEGVSEEVSRTIAGTLWEMEGIGADVRQAVMVGRLGSGDPQRTLEVLNTVREVGWKWRRP